MNKTEALAELERRHPESAGLVALIRQATPSAGRPGKRPMTDLQRRQALRATILRILATTFASRTQLYRAVRNFATAEQLEYALMDLEIGGDVETETSTGKNGGRPLTLYCLKR